MKCASSFTTTAFAFGVLLLVQEKQTTITVNGFDVVRRTTTTTRTTDNNKSSRRDFLGGFVVATSTSVVVVAAPTLSSAIVVVTGPSDGNLPDLPPDAVRSYLQYRIPLQTAADFYVFDLLNLVKDPSEYGQVNDLFQATNSRGGQGNPSRIEREFTNVFRILGLSMPPELADDIFDAQYRFEKAVALISKTTAGIRRDLPVEIDAAAVVKQALAGWEEGRLALNEIFALLNTATGLSELKLIPANASEYGRSERKYLELKKKMRLCQNRGGPALAGAWGNLMVTGTVQEYCSLPDANEYFYQ